MCVDKDPLTYHVRLSRIYRTIRVLNTNLPKDHIYTYLCNTQRPINFEPENMIPVNMSKQWFYNVEDDSFKIDEEEVEQQLTGSLHQLYVSNTQISNDK